MPTLQIETSSRWDALALADKLPRHRLRERGLDAATIHAGERTYALGASTSP